MSPTIIHAGGEILSCGAWHAAVMLLPPGHPAAAIAHLESDSAQRQSFIRKTLGVDALAPYVVGRELFPRARAIIFCGVGGIDLDSDVAMRDEVCAKLRDADFIGVRDCFTLEILKQDGLPARLMPDPAVLLKALFEPVIERHAAIGECAAMRDAFPQGYLAMQWSADFGDDRTLDLLAGQIDALAQETGLGVVLFRAGAAPLHDDATAYARLRHRLAHCESRIFESLDVFDICALIAGSAGFCGSSLHGRIVAMAFGLPRASLCYPPCDPRGKTAAFVTAWDPQMPPPVPPQQLARSMMAALAAPAAALREAGENAAAACRQSFDAIRTILG